MKKNLLRCITVIFCCMLMMPVAAQNDNDSTSSIPEQSQIEDAVYQALTEQPSVRVILVLESVQFNTPVINRQTAIAELQTQVLESLAGTADGFNLHYQFEHAALISGFINENTLPLLESDARIRGVYLDIPTYATGSGVVELGVDDIHSTDNITGANVTVAVIDTGLNYGYSAYADVQDAVVKEKCFTNNACYTTSSTLSSIGDFARDEGSGHGTDVSRVITGQTGYAYAPDAEIVAIRTLDDLGQGYISDWLAALDWIASNQAIYGIDVVNMSLATQSVESTRCSAGNDNILYLEAEALFQQLEDQSVVVVASSGNFGNAELTMPACFPTVLAVAATYTGNVGTVPTSDDYQALSSNFPACVDTNTSLNTLACFSNTGDGSKDLVALPGVFLDESNEIALAGTSFSAPAVSGLLALIQQSSLTSISPATIRTMLTSPTNSETVQRSNGTLLSHVRRLIPDNLVANPSCDAEISAGDISALGTALAAGGRICLAANSVYEITTNYSINNSVEIIARGATLRAVVDTNTPLFTVTTNGNLSIQQAILEETTNDGILDNAGITLIERSTIRESQSPLKNLNGGTLTLFDVRIESNTSSFNAAVLDNDSGATATLTNSFISDNNAGSGRVLVNDGAMSLNNVILLANNSNFEGGALYQGATGTLDISNSNFDANESISNGGALYATGGNVSIIDSSFTNNIAADGSAIYAGASSSMTIESTSFVDNAKPDGASDVALIHNLTNSFAIIDSVFIGNSTDRLIHSEAPVSIENSFFNRNILSAISAIYINDAGIAPSLIEGSAFVSNYAGNILTVADGTLNFQNSMLYDNNATTNAMLVVQSTATLDLLHLTLVDNQGTYLQNSGGILNLHNSIVVNDIGDACSAAISSTTGSFITDATCAGTGTTTTRQSLVLSDLLYTRRLTPIMRIDNDSVAYDAADTGLCAGLSVDQHDGPRSVDVACDAGAYEYRTAPTQDYLDAPNIDEDEVSRYDYGGQILVAGAGGTETGEDALATCYTDGEESYHLSFQGRSSFSSERSGRSSFSSERSGDSFFLQFLTAGSNYDIVLGIYRVDPNAPGSNPFAKLEEIACLDNPTDDDYVAFNTDEFINGTEYRVIVWRKNGESGEDLALQIRNISFLSCATNVDIATSECNVLVDLFLSTFADNEAAWSDSKYDEWLNVNNICDWEGVQCNVQGTSITNLILDDITPPVGFDTMWDYYLSLLVADPTDGVIVTTTNMNYLDDGLCSLPEAIIAVNTDSASGSLAGECDGTVSDTIYLTRFGIYSLDAIGTNSDGNTGLPSIATNVIIQGQGAIIERLLDAPDFRIFNVTDTGSLTLQDMALIGGSAIEGGAIYTAGDLTLNNVELSNNFAFGSGGAIFVDDSLATPVLSLSSVSMIGNAAYSDGGALYYPAGVMTISDSNFENNSTRANGGALIVGDVTLSNTQFTDNTARFDGGALYALSVDITDTDFVSNHAGQDGGAAYVETSLTAIGGTFHQNDADDNGGAIVSVASGTVTATDTQFTHNSVNGDGGAIFTSGGAITLNHVSMTNNSADNGGAINTNSGSILVTVSDLNNNSATVQGGAIYNNSGTTQVVRSSFVTNSSGATGGAIHSQAVDAENSTFSGNNANQNGSAIYANANANIRWSTVAYNTTAPEAIHVSSLNALANVFSDNDNNNCNVTASTSSHNISDDISCGLVGTGDIENTTAGLLPLETQANGTQAHPLNIATSQAYEHVPVATCTASISSDQRQLVRPQEIDCESGAYEATPTGITYQCFATVVGSNITHASVDHTAVQQAVDSASANDTVLVAGTCVGVSDFSSQTVDETVHIDLSLTLQGGYTIVNGIVDWDSPIDTLNNKAILDANQVGKVMFIDGDVGVTLDGIVLRNGSGSNGGALYSAAGTAQTILIQESSIEFNSTTDDGGAIYMGASTSNLTLQNVNLDNNHSQTLGGAIYAGSGVSLFVEDSIFTSNLSSNGGGGIYAINVASLSLQNVNATSNQAVQSAGGFLWADTPIAMTIANSSFTLNRSTSGGAILLTNSGSLTISNSQFTDNIATTTGGAITANSSSNLVLTDSNLDSNEADNGGAIALIQSAYGEILWSQLTDNTASDYGGAVYVNIDAATAAIVGSTLSGNSATTFDGGAIYGGSSVTIINSLLHNNFTGGTGQGGAIALTNSLRVVNSTLSSNQANDGGAIYNVPNLELRGATLTQNTATNSGGAIWLVNKPLNSYNSLITGNTAGNASSQSDNIYNPGGSVNFLNTIVGASSDAGCVVCTNAIIPTEAVGQILDLVLSDNGGDTFTHALVVGSPAIDVGNNGATSLGDTFDVDNDGDTSEYIDVDQRGAGFDRIHNGTVDVGAVEFVPFCRATPDNGTTIFNSNDNTAVQQAVDAASAGAIVKIAGSCVGASDTSSDLDNETVYINKDITLQGGYAGISLDWNAAPDAATYPTILDANSLGRVIFVDGVSVVLDSLTIQNGLVSAIEADGGGIYVLNGTLTVTNSIIQDNSAPNDDGGGIEANNSMVIVHNSIIQNNTADISVSGAIGAGGGVHGHSGSTVRIENSIIRGNSACIAGGVGVGDGTLEIINNTVIGGTQGADSNSAPCSTTAGGGGVSVDNANLIIDDSTISGNTSVRGAGISNLGTSTATIIDSVIGGEQGISGNSATTFGGGIYTEATASLSLNNTTVSGNSSASGGGIYANGALTISDSTIGGIQGTTGNVASGSGGGIYVLGITNISDTNVSGNVATSSGGGIYADNQLTILDSNIGGLQGITGNDGSFGGGIKISTVNTILIERTTISGNNAVGGRGGAIHSDTGGESVVIRDSIIGGLSSSEGNTTTLYGGGIANESSQIVIENTTFAYNVAGDINNTGRGGAIYNWARVDITNSTFSHNQADIGSALNTNNDYADNIFVYYSTIAFNSGVTDPNAYAVFAESPGRIELNQSVIAHNPLLGGGNNCDGRKEGVDSFQTGSSCIGATNNAHIVLSDLQDNGGSVPTHLLEVGSDGINAVSSNCPASDARGVSRPQGTACDAGATELPLQCFVDKDGDNVTDFESVDHMAVRDAMASVPDNATLRVAGMCIGTSDDGSGPETLTFTTTQPWTTITIEGGYPLVNGLPDWAVAPDPVNTPTILDANHSGRVVRVDGASMNVTLRNLTLQNGSATSGAGIQNINSTLTLDTVTVQNNAATDYGGGLSSDGGSVTIAASHIQQNDATNAGGGFHANNSTIIINNGTIIGGSGIGNTANNGAGFYATGVASDVTVQDSSIIDNTAATNGGGFVNQSGLVTLNNAMVSDNDASAGGGIYNNLGTLTLNTSTVKLNTATSGGGIYNLSGIANILDTSWIGGIASGNQATNGAGIYSVSDVSNATLIVDDSTVSYNQTTTGYGGGLVVTQLGSFSSAEIRTNSAIDSNIANIQGGGIYVDNGASVTISSSTVSTNSSTTAGGGGIYNQASTLNMNNASLITNNAATNGGGIYSNGNHQTTLDASTVANNSATNGGAIYSNAGTLTLQNGTMIGGNSGTDANQATSGGGIYLEGSGGQTHISNSLVQNNTASSHGGGMYVTSQAITLTDSFVANNTATFGDGGGIYNNSNGAAVIERSGIDGNVAGGRGGGLMTTNAFTSNGIVLKRTYVTHNVTAGDGGGIFVTAALLNLENVTISSNTASQGGGLAADGLSVIPPIVQITFTTITNNTATSDASDGLFEQDSEFYISNTLITDNPNDLATDNCLLDPSSNWNDDGGNFDDGASCDFSNNNVTIVLGLLADNGGATLTHELVSGAAIDSATSCTVSVDQRGTLRPVGANCDAGAYEALPAWDVNEDGVVSPVDAVYVVNRIGTGDLTADIDGDGDVDNDDVNIVLQHLP